MQTHRRCQSRRHLSGPACSERAALMPALGSGTRMQSTPRCSPAGRRAHSCSEEGTLSPVRCRDNHLQPCRPLGNLPATDLYDLAETCFPMDTSFLPKRKRHPLPLCHANMSICLFLTRLSCPSFPAQLGTWRRVLLMGLVSVIPTDSANERLESAIASHLQTITCTRESCDPLSNPSGCFVPLSVCGGRWLSLCPIPLFRNIH